MQARQVILIVSFIEVVISNRFVLIDVAFFIQLLLEEVNELIAVFDITSLLQKVFCHHLVKQVIVRNLFVV